MAQMRLAGIEDWSLLTLHVNAIRGDPAAPVEGARVDDLRFGVGGLSLKDSASIHHHFRWADKLLQVGSKDVVTVVDTDRPDPPLRRYRSDAEVQESPFTDEEMRELRRQDYEALKRSLGSRHSEHSCSKRMGLLRFPRSRPSHAPRYFSAPPHGLLQTGRGAHARLDRPTGSADPELHVRKSSFRQAGRPGARTRIEE
jgi:hypothetical protein